ncbi:MAG: D-alanyl-D-alanine carboxypeptidase [Clostridiales bacterium]|nr:D-alanyl-D-alanine carboxypeptidase [Clostridiales bacterium]
MKRAIAFVMTIAALTFSVCAASAPSGDVIDYDAAQTIADISELDCASAVLCDLDSGRILLELNADERRAPASVTKIMTMLLVLEACDSGAVSLDDTVTASEHACSMGGSQIYLEPGEQMTVLELFKSVSIASANDAAVALAEHIGGSEELFVQAMNSRAAELGMTNTEFKNACGLDEDGHLTTARDIALMSAELCRHSEAFMFTTTWMDSVRNGEFGLTNTNKLIKSYSGLTGLKTGSTGNAKFCISATAEKNGMRLCAVVMGAETSAIRFECATALLNLGFASYESFDPTEGLSLPEIPVIHGKNEALSLVAGEHESILISRGSSPEVNISCEYPKSVEAPISAGTEVGKITVSQNGETLCVIPVLSGADIEKLGFFAAFARLLGALRPF